MKVSVFIASLGFSMFGFSVAGYGAIDETKLPHYKQYPCQTQNGSHNMEYTEKFNRVGDYVVADILNTADGTKTTYFGYLQMPNEIVDKNELDPTASLPHVKNNFGEFNFPYTDYQVGTYKADDGSLFKLTEVFKNICPRCASIDAPIQSITASLITKTEQLDFNCYAK